MHGLDGGTGRMMKAETCARETLIKSSLSTGSIDKVVPA